MVYEYTGYLKLILDAPDERERDALEFVEFTADDIAQWSTRDLESDSEWKRVAALRSRTSDGVRLTGRFEDVRRMDSISPDDPSFWVPLGTLDWHDPRFPIDLSRYPIVEVTYRCTSDNAHPVWVWTYPGGLHVDSLPRTRQWRRLARRIPYMGFPTHITALLFRLYSTTRTTESFEVSAVRFRTMSAREHDACEKDLQVLSDRRPPRKYPVLEEFMPLGTCMNANTVRRSAELLGISLNEYWWLAMEDIVKHHHNCISIEEAGTMSPAEWGELLSSAARFGVKVAATFDFDLRDDPQILRQTIETQIKPFVNSPEVLAWSLRKEPPEIDFKAMLQAKDWVEEIDRRHPVSVVTRHPSAYPLYAPYFAASGINHYVSHAPWQLGDIVREHARLAGGQQFWIVGPAFLYATGTPEWSTCPEMRLMINLSFVNGARGWFSYAFHNDPIWLMGSCQRTLTGPFLMFSDLWLELDRRMERITALAPLLLQTHPARLPKEWYAATASSDEFAQLPEGLPPTTAFRLRGPDFNLFCAVSNDVRGMSSFNLSIPRENLQGREIYDLTDFIQNRTWAPMNLERHIEMFPGQAQFVIMADKAVCERWRDVVAERLIDDDRRQLAFNMDLARSYGLNTGEIETLIGNVGGGDPMHDLAAMDLARDKLVDLMYSAPPICETRSRIIEASAGVCACDGALCRLVGRGKLDVAKEWGAKVIPLAREITHLRLELRRGKGQDVVGYAEDLTRRTLGLLQEIRAIP
ncbi:MAG: hypothetical protein AMXMBFR4_14620 [Candidatus Hydrogenedentota bacterium]